MIKKVVVGACVVAAVLAVLGSGFAARVVKRTKSYVHETMAAENALDEKEKAKPEATVEQIRKEIADLDEEVKKYRSAVAEETVAVEDLRDEIARIDENHQKQLDLIRIMRKDIANCDDTGDKYVTYGDQKYSVERVRNKLTRDWETYKQTEDALKSKRQMLAAREVSLTAVREGLAEMRAKKDDMEIQLAQIEADLKNVRLAESRSDFHFDDTKLGDIQKDMSKVRRWIKVKREEIQPEGKFSDDPIPVGKKNTTVNAKADVLKEIDAALEKKSDTKLSIDK